MPKAKFLERALLIWLMLYALLLFWTAFAVLD
jgi:hypothetical protein